MNRHNLDARVFDYTWKQNRLSKDKEALKNSMLNVIRKKPRKETDKKEAVGAQGMVVDQQHAQAY